MVGIHAAFCRSKVTDPEKTWAKWIIHAKWIKNKLTKGLNGHILRTATLLPLPRSARTMHSTHVHEEGLDEERRGPHARASMHTEVTAPCIAPTEL